MVEARRPTGRLLRGSGLAVLAAVIVLAGCGGKAVSGTALSASDAKALKVMNAVTTLMDKSAAAAKAYLTSLKDGTWLQKSGPQQLDMLTHMESLSQTLLKQITDGFPKATAPDLLAAEKGVLRNAAKSCSEFISVAVLSIADTIYMSPQFIAHARAKWMKRILANEPRYEAARAELARVLPALNSKYGFTP